LEARTGRARVCWAMAFRGFKKDSVIGNFDKYAFGSMTWLEGKIEIRIERYRKHPEHGEKIFVFVNGVSKTMATNDDTQRLINRILGTEFRLFKNGNMIGQADMNKFIDQTDAKQKDILDKFFGVEEIDEAYKESVQNVTNMDRCINSINGHLVTLGNRNSDLYNEVVDLEEKEKDFNLNHAKQIQELKAQIASQREHIELMEIQNPAVVMEAQINDLLERVAVSKSSEKFQKYNSTVKKVADAIQKLNLEVHDLATQQSYTVKTQGKIDLSTNQCDKCGAEIDLSLKQKEYNDLQLELDEHRIQAQVKTSKIGQIDAKASNIRSELAEMEGLIKETETKCSALTHQKATAEAGYVRSLKKAKRDLVIMEGNLTKYDAIKPDYTAMIIKKQKEIKSNQSKISCYYGMQAFAGQLLESYEYWKKAYGPSGIKSAMFREIVPALNTNANEYLQLLSDNKMKIDISEKSSTQKGDIKNKISIKLEDARGSRDYKTRWSKGQKNIAALSVDFSFMKLSTMMSKNYVSFSFWDEVDASLDPEAVKRLSALLQVLSEDISTLLVVTHNESLTDYINNAITVKLINEGTELEESVLAA